MKIPTSAAPDVQQAFREAWAAIGKWEGTQAVDLKGRVIGNAGRSVNPRDYVTRAELDEATRTVTTPSTVTSSTPTADYYGTHAGRLARSAASVQDGASWYETDRHALYEAQGSAWVLVWGYYVVSSSASLPGDLGTDDAFFYCMDKGAGIVYRWSGAVWHYHQGTIRDTYANRPTIADDVVDGGVFFEATDWTNVRWMYINDGATGWVYVSGVYMNTWANLPAVASLTAGDTGLRFWGTDSFAEVYFDGAAWQQVQLRAEYVTGDLTVTKFGCNGTAAQAAYASGGALTGYTTGAFGLDSDAHMQALFDLVVKIRAALVANGIMS